MTSLFVHFDWLDFVKSWIQWHRFTKGLLHLSGEERLPLPLSFDLSLSREGDGWRHVESCLRCDVFFSTETPSIGLLSTLHDPAIYFGQCAVPIPFGQCSGHSYCSFQPLFHFNHYTLTISMDQLYTCRLGLFFNFYSVPWESIKGDPRLSSILDFFPILNTGTSLKSGWQGSAKRVVLITCRPLHFECCHPWR